jgi:hypothetical protein
MATLTFHLQTQKPPWGRLRWELMAANVCSEVNICSYLSLYAKVESVDINQLVLSIIFKLNAGYADNGRISVAFMADANPFFIA